MAWFRRKKSDSEKWNEMNKMVLMLAKEKKLDEALTAAHELYKSALKDFGKKHKNTATALNNLGFINMFKKNFDEAESYLLMALQVSEKVHGRFSREVAVVNMNLGKLYMTKAKEINNIVRAFDANWQPEAENKNMSETSADKNYTGVSQFAEA